MICHLKKGKLKGTEWGGLEIKVGESTSTMKFKRAETQGVRKPESKRRQWF